MEPDSEIRYEKRDIKAGPVVWVLVGICVVSVVGALLLIPFMGLLESWSARNDPPSSPLAGDVTAQQPPQPRLQELPFADIEAMRAEQQALLSSYGWIDREAGVVRIPVDEAQRQIAKRGLPSREPSPSPQEGAQ